MSISSGNRRAGVYKGTGAVVNYPFVFKIFNAEDVRVYVADTDGRERVLSGGEYSVAKNADQETHPGGSITLTAPLPTDHLLTIISAMAIEQPTTFTNQGGFYPRVLNDALDRLTIYCQQLEERLLRTMSGAVNADKPLALPAPQSGTLLGWDSQGGMANIATESSETQGGTDKIATAEAVKKVSDRLIADKKALQESIDANKTAAADRADTDKRELTAQLAADKSELVSALAAAKQEIADLRQAVNALSGGSAALELINRIAAAEASVAALNNKVNSTVQSVTDTLASTRTEIRDETTAALKQLRVLALAGL